MTTYDEVLFSELSGVDGNVGIITLNRPSVLNSLNQAMVNAMMAQLQKWAKAKEIKAVVIQAAQGRAFCAGGDLRAMYERWVNHDPSLSDFFRDEYQLNRFIYHFPKPYIAFFDGITMGGGVGVSIHGSHRIATDNFIFAMPETGIGFYPDIGGTYFLPRLKGQFGIYLGLTGTKLKCDDAVTFGIADYKIVPESFPLILDDLAATPFAKDAKQSVSAIIKKYAVPVSISALSSLQPLLDDCFNKSTMEEIIAALTAANQEDIVKELLKKSPLSLKITLRALREGKLTDFDTCMQREFRLTCHFLEGHDFLEGIRALIIDKDQRPRWQPATVNDVQETMIDKYFAPLSKEFV